MKKFLIIILLLSFFSFSYADISNNVSGYPASPLKAVQYSDVSTDLPSPENNIVTIYPSDNVSIAPVLEVTDVNDLNKNSKIMMYIVIGENGYELLSYNANIKPEIIFKNIPANI